MPGSAERMEFVQRCRQSLEDHGLEPQGELVRLLALCRFAAEYGSSETTWDASSAQLLEGIEKARQAQQPELAPLRIEPFRLHGRNGLALQRVCLPDGRTLDAFRAVDGLARQYHERQRGAECTLSTVNMINVFLKGWLGLNTEAELRQWLREHCGGEQTGHYDTVQVCRFNNRQPPEGRAYLLVANLGLSGSGRIEHALDPQYQSLATDFFDRMDVIGLVMVMPNPARDAVLRSSPHTVMVCRTTPGRYEVRDPRNAQLLDFEAEHMGAAIGECRRRLGISGNSQQANTVEVIYPAPRPQAGSEQEFKP
ncbi:hypothetical protein GT347_00665 [Xylophilus rhododendri]|uniref:Uncharacterized protein n=1 Tax=Xylophilus rhododendri TaxID=2697032 RepID=A0A857IZA5_9BURK|nr:hypothetical protein [Xylophilus rhododendri]QHI96637.1 hypothetical protein GT347_00665 [Xylophilus rhododendri]